MAHTAGSNHKVKKSMLYPLAVQSARHYAHNVSEWDQLIHECAARFTRDPLRWRVYADGTPPTIEQFASRLLTDWPAIVAFDYRSWAQFSWPHDQIEVGRDENDRPIYACRVGSYLKPTYRATRHQDDSERADIDMHKTSMAQRTVQELRVMGYGPIVYAPRTDNAASIRWVREQWLGHFVGEHASFLRVEGRPQGALIFTADAAHLDLVRSLVPQWAAWHDPGWPD